MLWPLTLKDGGDPLNAADWTKSANPVFTKNTPGGVYGPGHNGFFSHQTVQKTGLFIMPTAQDKAVVMHVVPVLNRLHGILMAHLILERR